MSKIMVACDVDSKAELLTLIEKFDQQEKPCLKIGMQLFYQEGVPLIEMLKEQGYEIFLDLKLHDIPQTVFNTVQAIAKLGVEYLTIHASGGKEMMFAASNAAAGSELKLLAVTVLTSMSKEELATDLQVNIGLEQLIENYAKNAHEAGVDGCICSPHEVKIIKNVTSNEFLCVTPGIQGSDMKNDQARVATPAFAASEGADALVIGRMITKSSHPGQTYAAILEEIR